jgi:hypothetical protein
MSITPRALLLLLILPIACATGINRAPTDDAAETRSGDTPAEPTCGDGVCGLEELCDVCLDDCGRCAAPPGCGDDICGPEENCGSCEADCGPCGTSSSGAGGGSPGSGGSGAGGAGGGFTPTCGDTYCDPPESPQGCPQDCQQVGGGTCAHGACEEGAALDPSCDLCATVVCGLDSFCCDTNWDVLCVASADLFCGCS